MDMKDTLALKGFAIAAIVLHNYYHLLGPVTENEFDFHGGRFDVFLKSMQDPQDAAPALFSFLGHYGVQAFIFVSAYGLARRYWDDSLSWVDFMWSRVKRVYPMFLLAILTWALFMGLAGANPVEILTQNFQLLTLTVLGVQNLIPGATLPPIGPWWFIPFIMQVYALWPALRWVAKRYEVRGLIGLACLSTALVYIANDALVSRWSIHLLETPIGHMPELCLGVLAARYGFVPGRAAGSAGSVLLIAGNVEKVFWPLSFVGALLLMLALYQAAGHWLRRSALIQELGACSMALFFVNGFVRAPFIALAHHKLWAYALLLGIASSVFAVLLARLLTRIERAIGASVGSRLRKAIA
jgi:peptidoglycan/LPS O-acetylase OafA/YrhL